jgi:hypothetical protein
MKINIFILKNIFLGLLLFSLLNSCENKKSNSICDNQDDTSCYFEGGYYYYKKIPLGNMCKDYILIGFDSIMSNKDIVSFINTQSNFVKVADSSILKFRDYPYKHVLVKFITSKSCSEITSVINCLKENDFIGFVHFTIPASCNDGLNSSKGQIGKKCLYSFSSLFYVCVKDTNDLKDLNKVVGETRTKIIRKDVFMNDWFTLSINKDSKGDAIHMANYFFETGLFVSASPDIFTIVAE